MTHVMKMFDPSKYVSAVDLNGKECTVTIARVTPGEVVGEKNRKAKKPLVYFKGAGKPLALNKTNAKTISKMYGPEVERWVGQKVTIYPTTTQMRVNGVEETVECIRVRPKISQTAIDGPTPTMTEAATESEETSDANA